MKPSLPISLALAILVAITSACSSPPDPAKQTTSSIDVEATVQARLQEERMRAPITTQPPEPLTEATAAGKLLPSVVRVSTEAGMGSGVVIGDGLIITNRHVVEDAPTVSIQTVGSQSLEGKVVARNTILDLALVQVSGLTAPAADLTDITRMKPAESVLAIGYPLDLKGDATVTRGLFSAVRLGEPLPGEWVQTDASVNPGNSGGPLANLRGEVVGLITLRRTADDFTPVQGINFALSATSIKEALPAMLLSAGSVPPGATALDEGTSREIASFLQNYDEAEIRAFSKSDAADVRDLSAPGLFSFTSSMIAVQKTLNIRRESQLLDFKLQVAYSLSGDLVVADVSELWHTQVYRGDQMVADEGETNQPQVVVVKRAPNGWLLAAVQFRETERGARATATPAAGRTPAPRRPTATPIPSNRTTSAS